jgi:hypothetical protein
MWLDCKGAQTAQVYGIERLSYVENRLSGHYRINIAFTIAIAKTHWFAQEVSVAYYAPESHVSQQPGVKSFGER